MQGEWDSGGELSPFPEGALMSACKKTALEDSTVTKTLRERGGPCSKIDLIPVPI